MIKLNSIPPNVFWVVILILFMLPQQLVARDMGVHSRRALDPILPITGELPWGYDSEAGPANWASLSDEFAGCGAGTRQSPVDIGETTDSLLPSLSFHYRTSVLSLRRGRNALWIEYDSGSYLKIAGKRYALTGFEFHTPGEHSFHGQRPAMEIHLRHVGPSGKPLIVAIPVVGGHRKNITPSRILENAPGGNGRRQYRRVGVNAIFLLPVDRSYLFYEGSETTPPCTENVSWIIFNKPIRVSSESIGLVNGIVGHNTRPIQPLNGRVILRDSR